MGHYFQNSVRKMRWDILNSCVQLWVGQNLAFFLGQWIDGTKLDNVSPHDLPAVLPPRCFVFLKSGKRINFLSRFTGSINTMREMRIYTMGSEQSPIVIAENLFLEISVIISKLLQVPNPYFAGRTVERFQEGYQKSWIYFSASRNSLRRYQCSERRFCVLLELWNRHF